METKVLSSFELLVRGVLVGWRYKLSCGHTLWSTRFLLLGEHYPCACTATAPNAPLLTESPFRAILEEEGKPMANEKNELKLGAWYTPRPGCSVFGNNSVGATSSSGGDVKFFVCKLEGNGNHMLDVWTLGLEGWMRSDVVWVNPSELSKLKECEAPSGVAPAYRQNAPEAATVEIKQPAYTVAKGQFWKHKITGAVVEVVGEATPGALSTIEVIERAPGRPTRRLSHYVEAIIRDFEPACGLARYLGRRTIGHAVATFVYGVSEVGQVLHCFVWDNGEAKLFVLGAEATKAEGLTWVSAMGIDDEAGRAFKRFEENGHKLPEEEPKPAPRDPNYRVFVLNKPMPFGKQTPYAPGTKLYLIGEGKHPEYWNVKVGNDSRYLHMAKILGYCDETSLDEKGADKHFIDSARFNLQRWVADLAEAEAITKAATPTPPPAKKDVVRLWGIVEYIAPDEYRRGVLAYFRVLFSQLVGHCFGGPTEHFAHAQEGHPHSYELSQRQLDSVGGIDIGQPFLLVGEGAEGEKLAVIKIERWTSDNDPPLEPKKVVEGNQ